MSNTMLRETAAYPNPQRSGITRLTATAVETSTKNLPPKLPSSLGSKSRSHGTHRQRRWRVKAGVNGELACCLLADWSFSSFRVFFSLQYIHKSQWVNRWWVEFTANYEVTNICVWFSPAFHLCFAMPFLVATEGVKSSMREVLILVSFYS